MAVSEMKVARTFIRKAMRTTATTTAASTSTLFRLSIDVSMNVACRNWTLVAEMPAGSVRWMACNAASICFVSATVSAPGCF